MNPLNLLTGYKTYLGAAGMIGLAVYLLSQGQVEAALAALAAGLATTGEGHKIDRTLKAIEDLKANPPKPQRKPRTPKPPSSGPVAAIIVAAGISVAASGCAWFSARYDGECIRDCAADCIRRCDSECSEKTE